MADASALKLGKGLSLPLDVVTRRTAIVGQTDTGKTSTAVVMTEEAHAAGAQAVVIDPSGAWWGITSSADGKKPGLDMVVLGGEHGAVPLNAGAGRAVARLVAENGISAVLDLDRPYFTSWASRLRFVADFLSELYEVCNSQILVVIDESHRFAPQSVRDEGGDAARCLGAVVDAVALGRRRGLGIVVITQRLAKLHKDVLELCEIMVAHRLRGNNDRKALQGWLENAGEDIKAIMAEVARLERGVAHVSAPTLGIDGIYTIRPKRTFDSSRSIGIGESAVRPTASADVDLDAVRAMLAETIEQVATDDPKELRRKIAELERQLRERPAAKAEPVEVKVQVPPAGLRDDMIDLRGLGRTLLDSSNSINSAIARMCGSYAGEPLMVGGGAERVETVRVIDTPGAHAHHAPGPVVPVRHDPPSSSDMSPNGDAPATLKAGAKRMVEVLERYGRPLDRSQLSTLAVVSKGGTMSDYLSALRTIGLIEEPSGMVQLTEAGMKYAADVLGINASFQPYTPEQVVALHERRLKAGARRMLDCLMRAHPDGFTRKELGGLASVSAGGTLSDYLSSLRTRGLAEERSRRVFAGSVLYLGVAKAR